MSNFIGRPPFLNSQWVGIEAMQFHIAQTKIFLRTPSFPIQGVPMNNLAPKKNCPGGVQGNLNWMPGYIQLDQSSKSGLGLYRHAYFVYASSEGSSEFAHARLAEPSMLEMR